VNILVQFAYKDSRQTRKIYSSNDWPASQKQVFSVTLRNYLSSPHIPRQPSFLVMLPNSQQDVNFYTCHGCTIIFVLPYTHYSTALRDRLLDHSVRRIRHTPPKSSNGLLSSNCIRLKSSTRCLPQPLELPEPTCK